MEKECSKCHRLFYTGQEDAELCPECLKNEFKAVAQPLDEADWKSLVEEYKQADKRQTSRAERMREGYASGAMFSFSGKLRFAFGCGLFLLCVLWFMTALNAENPNFISELDLLGQRVISALFCVVSAALVATSTRRYTKVVYSAAAFMLLSGWYMPVVFKKAPVATEIQETTTSAAARDAETTPKTTDEQAVISEGDRALTSADLEVFAQQKAAVPQAAHYAVYMDKQDSRTRAIIRDALTRLLGGDYTRAYTRNDGALYVVTNVPGRPKNISRILGRFGKIAYAAPADGIYELRFDPEKTHMVSRYPVEVLATPTNASYVPANIDELLCPDAMRIRAAAKSLHASNVQMLRHEIHDALMQVIQDPWTSDFDTYSVLAEALVTYAYEKDAAVVDACRKFFRLGLEMQRDIPENVTAYLVREVPEEMVEPVVAFWCSNPIVWNETMTGLGIRVQEPLLVRLKQADSIREIGSIIRYLKDHGDARAVESIRPFTEHQDSIIRHSAQETINALQNRR